MANFYLFIRIPKAKQVYSMFFHSQYLKGLSNLITEFTVKPL